MTWSLFWQAIGIITFGTLIFRMGGRKSIAQMTIAQVVVMIGLGSLLIQPLSGHGFWPTLIVAAILILMMILMEFIELKSNTMEFLISGRSVVVIENSELRMDNLKKVRLSVDKLELRLRQAGISHISDVEWATIEVSGNLGYQLKPDKQPATKGDIEQIRKLLEALQPGSTQMNPGTKAPEDTNNNFREISQGHDRKPPKILQ